MIGSSAPKKLVNPFAHIEEKEIIQKPKIKQSKREPNLSIVIDSRHGKSVLHVTVRPLEATWNELCVGRLLGIFLSPDITHSHLKDTPGGSVPVAASPLFNPLLVASLNKFSLDAALPIAGIYLYICIYICIYIYIYICIYTYIYTCIYICIYINIFIIYVGIHAHMHVYIYTNRPIKPYMLYLRRYLYLYVCASTYIYIISKCIVRYIFIYTAGEMELIVEIHAPKIIIPDDCCTDRGCLLFEPGFLVIIGDISQ
jgi:hypothetical protein